MEKNHLEGVRRSEHPAVQKIIWAAQLLPWWVNLILAEVTFVVLYLLKSGLPILLTVPSLFLAASVIATIERDREINEQNQLRRRQVKEEQAVTKFIVKDLMREKYRESFLEARKQQEGNSEKYSSMIILGLIVVTLIGSTVIMLKVAGKEFNKEAGLANAAPKYEPPAAVVQPRQYQSAVKKPVAPAVSSRNWSQYGYDSSRSVMPAKEEPKKERYDRSSKKIHAYEINGITYYTNSPESIEEKIRMRRKAAVAESKNEDVSSYSVIFKSGKKQFCIDAARMQSDVLTVFVNEHLRMEIPVEEINYVEAWYEVGGKSRMRVLSVDDL